MPTYVYKYRRRYGRRWSRYRRYGAYSRYRRRRSGTSSTASSRGRIRVRVPIQQVIAVPVAAAAQDSSIITSSPWYQAKLPLEAGADPSGMCGAVSTGLYRAYANLYDQVKCDGVVTRLSILTAIGSSTTPAIQVVMAYDRLGSYREVINKPASPSESSITTADLFNYSSAAVVSAINNSVAKTSRSCWATDIQERTQFHDCSLYGPSSSWTEIDRDFNSNANKVTYFSPLTLIGLRLAAAPSASTSIQVLLEQTYYFTFRNPKFGGSASGASVQSTRVAAAPVMAQRSDTRRLDTEGDMDDAGGLDDEDAQAAQPAARVARGTPLSSLFDSSIPVPARYRQ